MSYVFNWLQKFGKKLILTLKNLVISDIVFFQYIHIQKKIKYFHDSSVI